MDAKTPSLEKQKKGNLYVYKFSPISVPATRTPEHHPKKSIPASVWSLTKSLKSRSKPKPKPTQNGPTIYNSVKEEPQNKNDTILGMKMEARESVSSVEGILMNLEGVKEELQNKNDTILGMKMEARKSVSSVEGILMSLESGEKKKVVHGGRKSVSHVENNMAYVGKFVEKARKSTGAKLETNGDNVENAMELLQVKVLVTDMPGFMQLHASQCARKTYDSLEKFSAKHLAFNLKKEFDKVYGPAWHCIVGSSFGSFVTHATGCFFYFSMEKLCILLFRTKVQRALQQ